MTRYGWKWDMLVLLVLVALAVVVGGWTWDEITNF